MYYGVRSRRVGRASRAGRGQTRGRRTTSCPRSWAPSFTIAWLTCVLAVAGLMVRRTAISSLDGPPATALCGATVVMAQAAQHRHRVYWVSATPGLVRWRLG